MILQINEVINDESTETYIGEVDKVSFADMFLQYTRNKVECEVDYTEGDLKQIFLLNNNGKTLKGVYGIGNRKN